MELGEGEDEHQQVEEDAGEEVLQGGGAEDGDECEPSSKKNIIKVA